MSQLTHIRVAGGERIKFHPKKKEITMLDIAQRNRDNNYSIRNVSLGEIHFFQRNVADWN